MAEVPLFILYGSATGNAEQIAKDLAAKYKDNIPAPFNKLLCYEANDFKKKCLPIWEQEPPQSIARKYGLVFVTSTTGNGDCPENGSRFIRYLKRKGTVETLPLKHIAFAVLGLGDTNYDLFCESGKIVDRKLAECGGERVRALGMADEGTGLEDVVDPWVQDIVPVLASACSPADECVQEEKKSEDIASTTISQPVVSTPTIPAANGLSNIQSILNRRLGKSAPVQPNTSIVEPTPVVPVAVQRSTIPLAAQRLMQASAGKAAIKVVQSTKSADIKSPSPLFVLYGSATGNAEQIAKDLAGNYEKMIAEENDDCYFPSVICCEMDQYKKKCLSTWEDESLLKNDIGQKHGVLVVTSTTGNGEAPENASRFVRYVKRKNTVDAMPFRHVAFAVLALGDTNYDQFCETGQVVDKKMKELGGIKAQGVTCADEGTGLESVVDPWVASICSVLSKRCQGKEPENTAIENAEEEKADEMLPTKAPSADVEKNSDEKATDTMCTMSEPAVSVIKQILGKNIVPKVEEALVPSLGTSLSSCQLYHGDETYDKKSSRGLSLSELERLTVSSAGSSNINYRIDDPFHSSIVGARYLTQTDSEGAKLASEVLGCKAVGDTSTRDDKIIFAKKMVRDYFPLTGENAEKNGKRVIELKLSLPDDFTLEYQPGDSIGLSISNSAESVRFVLDMLNRNHGIVPTQKLSLDEKKPITVESAITDHIDLCSPVKNKRLLVALAQFAVNAEEADALRLLASKDPTGQDLFKKYIDEQRLNAVDILSQFPSCQSITLEGLLSILPRIAPRYYSISSSPIDQKDSTALSLTVAFSVVDYMTPILSLANGTRLQRRIGGIATSYLEAMCAPYLIGAQDIDNNFSLDAIKIFPKPTAEFRLPSNLSTPMILIGPGTGVAPFIGFLKHREAQLSAMDSTNVAKEVSEGTWRGGFDFEEEDLSVSRQDAKGLVMGADFRGDQRLGDIAVYYGCRQKDHDWLYKSEMESLNKSGIIRHLNVAFSRDSSASKTYVQDKLRNDEESICKMVMQNEATIYICGDGNAMAKGVQSALVDIFAKHFSKKEGVSEEIASEQARVLLEDLKERNKILLDIWS
jgi:sulfite reductase alpha subunit-like flavoprotein